MAYKIHLNKEICLDISYALHSGAESVTINGRDYPFEKTRNGYRYIEIADGNTRNDDIRFQVQNPFKQSRWGKLAREGHQITWGMTNDPRGWIRIVDNDVQVF